MDVLQITYTGSTDVRLHLWVISSASSDAWVNRSPFRDRSQTLVRGAWCKKGGPENFWGLKRGGPEKNTLILPLKNESIWFSVGLTPIFLAKKGGPRKILRSKRGALKIFRSKIFLHQAPPDKCLWTVPYYTLNTGGFQSFWYRLLHFVGSRLEKLVF